MVVISYRLSVVFYIQTIFPAMIYSLALSYPHKLGNPRVQIFFMAPVAYRHTAFFVLVPT